MGHVVEAVRLERLERLQASMRAHDVEICLLLNEPNVRYATGATAMPVYAMSTFVRCALVPQEGTPILFEHGNSVHRSAVRAPDVRPMHAWEFYDDPQAEAGAWADETLAAVRELGASGTSVAVDRLGTPGFLALERRNVALRDSAPITQEARRVKTPGERVLLERNGELVMEMLGALERAIEPGVTERELLAVLARTMIRGGGEYLATTTVCSGPNTNPWRAEATDRNVDSGDLVFVDTDTVGIEGMFSCVSRTFLAGRGRPAAEQADAYRAAHDWLLEMTALVRPGITCGELAHMAPRLPDRYLPQRYECMIHGIGLEEENPSVCYPQDRQSNADTVIEAHMALVVELYAGEVGSGHGVKLGDQVLVTEDGCRVLAPYPFDERLLVAG
ncbi:MAG TPA: Xaa-Pro peptidase family protein [Actinomycetota bacterium]|nr:Xaa-Pro peptidase family protein [Actinomycetota bacterium]